MMNKILKLKIVERFGTAANFSMIVQEDESAISRILNGRRKLNKDRQKVWAELLKTNTADLFGN